MNTIERIEARSSFPTPTSTYIVTAAEWATIKALIQSGRVMKTTNSVAVRMRAFHDFHEALSKLEN